VMQAGGHGNERSAPSGLLGSLLLHAACCVVLLKSTSWRLETIPEHSIEVEIVTSLPVAAGTESELQLPDSRSVTTPYPIVPDRKAVSVAPSDTTLRSVKPTRMLSEMILNDPRSRKAKETLSVMAADEQMIQLCSIEAMAQVGAWKETFQPDLLVAYAMKGIKISGYSLLADGAAFHSDQKWYNIKFKCELAPDHRRVTAFEFLVGDAIPQSRWERLNLPKGGPLD
jgi:Domain of Unknown Function (DUF930)